jgi:predicted transcriptional regulator
MRIQDQKTDLAKRILATKDKNVINYIQAIFDNDVDKWEEELPEYIRKSIESGLKDSANGKVKDHEVVMKKYRKWLKK